MEYREAIEWCEENVSVIYFNYNEVALVTCEGIIRESTFLTAVRAAMKKEELNEN